MTGVPSVEKCVWLFCTSVNVRAGVAGAKVLRAVSFMIDVLDAVYEAALVPEAWPNALELIAKRTGSASGSLLVFPAVNQAPRFKATDITREALEQHVTSDEWLHSRSAATAQALTSDADLLGFTYIRDFMTDDAVAADSVLKSLDQLGLDAQIGTLIPMMSGELTVVTFERWKAKGRHSNEEVEFLNAFRPHLARASLLAARLGLERARDMVSAMEALRLPAAVVTRNGYVMAVNTLFERHSHVFQSRAFGKIAISDANADGLLHMSIQEGLSGKEVLRSIAVPKTDRGPASVLHVLPVRRSATEIFEGGEFLIVCADVYLGGNGPPIPLLKGLFDLTPAEARVAASLAAGQTVQEAAASSNIQVSTCRSYLERIFYKTGTRQQSQLVALLGRMQAR